MGVVAIVGFIETITLKVYGELIEGVELTAACSSGGVDEIPDSGIGSPQN